MRCRQARKILGREMEGRGGLPGRADLKGHIASCAACAEFAEQLGSAWDLLGSVPGISPSEGFHDRVLARIRAAGAHESTATAWSFGQTLGWQWMAVAACVLMLGLVLVPGILRQPPAQVVSSTDQWDDSFLQELDSSLDQTEENYLPAYDAWAEDAAPSPESPAGTQNTPQNPGGVRHGKS